MTPEIKEIIKKMVAALTLKEKDQLSNYLHGYLLVMPGNSILEELENELGFSIQAEIMEQEEEFAHMDEVWETQYEPFLKGEEPDLSDNL